MTKVKKSAMGRGLGALLNSEELDIAELGDYRTVGSISEIPINQIEANPFQPRTEFDQIALQELAESIKIHGVIQPITVRKMGYEKYQLISGERRTRASLLAGLTKLPAYVRVANDQSMLEMALIENIQRENLNAIEVALSYQRLLEECDLKQEELGERVGKERSTVTNYLRLLKLPTEIQAAIKENTLTMGHARTIAGLKSTEEQLDLFHKIVSENLSVRATESIVKQKNIDKPNAISQDPFENPVLSELLLDYPQFAHPKYAFKLKKGNKGQLVVSFKNENELKELLEKLK